MAKSGIATTTRSTTRKVAVATKPKTKCDTFRELYKQATWIEKESTTTSFETVKSVTNGFLKHLDQCDCCNPATANIIISSCFIQQFSIISKNAIISMESIEKREKLAKEKEDLQKERQSTSDFAAKVESKFAFKIQNDAKFEHFNLLITFAIKALHYLQASHDADKTELCLNEILLSKMRVLGHLDSLFQIFLYYDLECYAFASVNLALSYIEKYFKLQTKNGILSASENVQIAYCNMVKILLNFGFIENARHFYKQHFPTFEDVNSINSYGTSLMFLLNCELSLRSRKGKEISEKLHQYITSGNYFNQSSIRRYAVKIMALLLASKFPSSSYKFSANYSEFVQPFAMTISVCKRWKLFGSDTDLTSDSLCFRFLIFNLASEAGELSISFHSNIGFLSDAGHYYKLNCNLFSSTFNIIGLAKMQLIGANYDFQNGHYSEAQSKIAIFEKLFTSKSLVNFSIFAPAADQIPTSQKAHCDEIESELPDSFAIAELKSLSTNAMDAYYKLVELNKPRNDHDIDSESFPSSLRKASPDFISSIYEKFNMLQPNRRIFKSAFYLHLKMVAIEIMIQHAQHKLKLSTNYCRQLLSVFENYTMKCYFPRIRSVPMSSSCLNLNLKTSIKEQIFQNISFGNLFWCIITFFVKAFFHLEMYEEALCYLKVVDFSSYTYETRTYRCEMFYFNAQIIYKMLKNGQNENLKKMSTLPCDLLIQSCQPNPVNQTKSTTKTPSKRSKKQTVPNAPKNTNGVSETVAKYAQKVLQVANDETITNNKAEGIRHNNILNFDEPTPTKSLNMRNKNALQSIYNKNSANSVRSQKQKPNNDYEEALVSNFNEILKFGSASNDNSETDLADLFNIEKLKNDLKGKQFSPNEIKILLNKIHSYIDSHPSPILYQGSEYLRFKHSRLSATKSSKSSYTQLYHFAESASYYSFRYRSVFVYHRKSQVVKQTSSDPERNLVTKSIGYELDGEKKGTPFWSDMPTNWRFVQLKLIDNGDQQFPDLLICRFQLNCEPAFLKVKCSQQEKIVKFFFDDFKEVMTGNSTSMLEVNSKIYWDLRFDFDNRLKMLLDSFEKTYLGPFKAIFLGQVDCDTKPSNAKCKCDKCTFRSACLWFKKRLLESAKTLKLECEDVALLEIFVESMIFSLPNEIEAGMKILFDSTSQQFISEITSLKKKYFKKWDSIEKKVALYNGVSPVGLILDSNICQFPFESLPTCRQVNQPFFRVPSLRIASILYKNFKDSYLATGVNDQSTYYLLNPSSNLANTEAFFKSKLISIEKWNGVIGKEPLPDDLKKHLENSELYLFFGHGAGSMYYRKVPNGGLDSINIKSVSIVIGCSSGRITSEGKIEETYGAAYRFLINGAPCFVGNLWDVTDKDIDLFTDKFMATWLKEWDTGSSKDLSLPKSLAMARDVCKLKWLIGCAPVVYGLPLHSIIGQISK